MIRRILFSTAAAAALLAAAPALAAEGTTSKAPCSCCSDGSNHATDHAIREANKEKASESTKQPRWENDPWFGTGYYGG
jgi:hypothetical protein